MRPSRSILSPLVALTASVLACNGEDLSDPSTATIEVTASTSGDAPDADGYTIQVDAQPAVQLAPGQTFRLTNVAPGTHIIQLGGVAANCTVQGANPRSVTVAGGATAEASFAIVCSATSGTIRVSVTTSGSTTDPNGYTVKLDNQDPGQPVGTTGSVTFSSVGAGSHSLMLAGVDSKCTVADGSSRDVTVTAGASSEVSFAVTCTSSGATHWSSIPFPAGFTPAGGFWASSASDLFVGSQGVILHYDGHTWTPQVQREGVGFKSIWGSAPNDVFAAATTGVILHYDGTSWSDMPGSSMSASQSYQAVWGTAARDVFAGGRNPLFTHYDGTAWSETEAQGTDIARIVDISGVAPADVYSIGPGALCDDCNRFLQFVAHYDGTRWQQVFEEAGDAFNAVWAGASNNVWVVGEGFDSDGYLLHFDGSTWTPSSYPIENGLNDVWGSSGTDVYAVGRVILHNDGTGWKEIKASPGLRVWGTSANDVFVLNSQEVLHGTP